MLALGAGLALAAATMACSPTSTESTTSSTAATSSTEARTGSSVATGDASSYGSIAALHQAIVDGGFPCTLEYPGLKDDVTSNEVSICTIEDETAYLTIWNDPAQLRAFVASPDGATGTVAVGSDWTIAVTSADLAGRLASALDGTAPAP